MNQHQPTLYEKFGGADTLHRLVDIFYDKVNRDPDLSPIFPDDLTETRNKQFKFLSQFFGGPSLFTEEYGPPMLRARHMPHEVTPTRAKAWLACMREALEETDIPPQVREEMFLRLSIPAQHMVNTPD